MNTAAASRSPTNVRLQWNQLQSLPDREGFAAPFAGVSNGALLVAGGANFPAGRPWEGGKKAWYDCVFVLESPTGSWREAGRLPRPIAYGVSASAAGGIVCAGGGDAREHFRDVFLLTWEQGQLRAKKLPDLPTTSAFGSGAIAGDYFYLAGGIEMPDSSAAQHTFWRLRITGDGNAWEEMPSWPGPARMLAQAGSIGGTFYLCGGVTLSAGPDGKPVRSYLRDAYQFDPKNGWKRLADLPTAVAAAPSPMPGSPRGGLCVISGDDGSRAHLIGPGHPGFSQDVLVYHSVGDRWAKAPTPAPISRATAPTVKWGDVWVIASGERKPGYRSPEVWVVEVLQ